MVRGVLEAVVGVALAAGAVSGPVAAQAAARVPLSFEGAVALAAGAPAVRLAEGRLTLARGELGAASAFVSGSVSAGYTRDLTPDADGSGAGTFDPVTATATLNVLPFGDAADARARAEGAVREAEAALGAARAETVVGAATSYLEALRLGQEGAALEAAVGVARTALEATRTRLEVGAASTADLLDTQIALSAAQNDLAEVALEEAQALAALAQTLGVSVPAVAGEPPRVTLPEVGNIGALLEGRADVLAARIAVESAYLARAAALRDALPSGSAGLSYGTGSVQVGAGFSTERFQPSLELSYDPDGLPGLGEPSPGLSARVGVSVPLDSGVGAGLAVADTAVTNADLLLGQTRAQAKLAVQAAQNQLATTRNSLAAGRALVGQRRVSLTTTRTRFDLGLVPAYEVSRAEAELLAARVQRGRLEDNVLLAQLLLLQALALDPSEVF